MTHATVASIVDTTSPPNLATAFFTSELLLLSLPTRATFTPDKGLLSDFLDELRERKNKAKQNKNLEQLFIMPPVLNPCLQNHTLPSAIISHSHVIYTTWIT